MVCGLHSVAGLVQRSAQAVVCGPRKAREKVCSLKKTQVGSSEFLAAAVAETRGAVFALKWGTAEILEYLMRMDVTCDLLKPLSEKNY